MIIAIDFDGTITKEHVYPEVGEIEDRTIEVLKNFKRNILFVFGHVEKENLWN